MMLMQQTSLHYTVDTLRPQQYFLFNKFEHNVVIFGKQHHESPAQLRY